MPEQKMYPIEEALKAQKALRALSGQGPEMFPIQAFVGMISDEVEVLRNHGKSDDEIASIIRQHSSIEITAQQLSEHYAPPELRHQHES